MPAEKCIPVKKKLIAYMAGQFPDFLFQGGNSTFYAFRRANADGLYDHIIIQREFFEGVLSLVITEAASCYNQSWKGIPWFTVGSSTDIGVLITGKNQYPADTGWHRINNSIEELDGLFEAIKSDIDTYVLKFFANSHERINSDKQMTAMNSYMKVQFTELSEVDISAVKQYLVDVSRANSEYWKQCKKAGTKQTIAYFDLIPLHPIVEKWLTEIQNALNYSYLSDKIRTKLIKDTTVLFRDRFNFYNLK